ncbi:MAG: phage/plasmid replication protein [Pseudomonadota bacterium]
MSLLTFPDRFKADMQSFVRELENESPVFVDWLTIRQVHPAGGIPTLSGGVMISTDADGAVEFQTLKRSDIEGSFDSRMWIRCDGNTVEFHGNISRWNRRDNVFGYSWAETISRVNRLLNLYSLPPFTDGEKFRYADSGEGWTGARVSRIDATANHTFFNLPDAQMALSILARHHVGRQKGTISPDGTTVMYGYGSKYVSGKCYLKSAELRTHLRKKSGSHVGQDVIEFCEMLGVIREEFTLKSRFLTQKNICWLADISQQEVHRMFNERTQMKRLHQMTYPDLSSLHPAIRGTLARYENGEPLNLKRATLYRHRKALLPFGIDISVPNNVKKFAPPVRTIERALLVAPEWYRKKYG